MEKIKGWIEKHPDLWEFIMFNLLSNCATVTNFVVMWICTGFIFKSFAATPFKFFVFNYADNIESNLGLCGFLSFLVATAAAQTVNFFVQKNFVFKSNAAFEKAVPKYIIFAIVLVLVSAALPAYSQAFLINTLKLPASLAPTIANIINIVVQVVLSYPTMKFWIMPKN
ncbi:MAG: GtrA family protein [Lachnospiraceae bacterium]|nr:GtrA family protein [Lachnospiraceae bacterium]MDN4744105.1 GtrA family protein [Lachnospiraceae bacterium C1.1]